MPRARSLLLALAVDTAKRSHDCQHNDGHRIAMGDRRMGVRDGRSPEYYCVPCALKFLEVARNRIDVLARELSGPAHAERGEITAGTSVA